MPSAVPTSGKASPGSASEAVLPLPNGMTVRLPSRQMLGAAKYVRNEIFVKRRYYRPGFEIRPTDTVVDIGANMGFFALWAAAQAPQGRVIAIEPTRVIECLEENLRANGLTNVTPLRVAVGHDGDELELVEYPGFNIITHRAGFRPSWMTHALISLAYGRYRQTPVHVKVPCRSLGGILDELGIERVNYLKIDCEGGEYDIFDSLTPEQWRRIDKVALEFHQYAPGQRHEKLVAVLQAAGFEVQVKKPFFEYYFMKFGEIWAKRPGS